MMLDEIGYAQELKSGIRCGGHGTARVYHDSAETVRHCFAVQREQEAETEACRLAELAYERHLENRGHWASLG